MKKALFILMCLIISACQPSPAASTAVSPMPISTVTITPTPSPTTRQPAASPTFSQPTKTQQPSVSHSPRPFSVCSPLEKETFHTLPEIITNPMDIPAFGQDTGHHGVDFAYYRRWDRLTIQGITVYAILPGKTVLTLPDQYPYGYTILIETPLSDLPESLQDQLLTDYVPVPENPGYRLNCPDMPIPEITGAFSVYHLYAHLESRPSFSSGDLIACGMPLGTVGNSGYSTNPHLHLETRLGPSGAAYSSMAHYQANATLQEMGSYCQWRMSGYYQLFDPFLLLQDEFPPTP